MYFSTELRATARGHVGRKQTLLIAANDKAQAQDLVANRVAALERAGAHVMHTAGGGVRKISVATFYEMASVHDVLGEFTPGQVSAEYDAFMARASESAITQDKPAPVIEGEGDLWSVRVTVDTTMSADVQVRASSRGDAMDRAVEVASKGGAHFEVDDGNYRGLGDYYIGDTSEQGVFQVDEAPATEALPKPRA